MCSCEQSLATVAFVWEKLSQPQFYKHLTRETAFLGGGGGWGVGGGGLVQVQ